jgi:TolA-binding protein
MESLISFAQQATPLGVITLLAGGIIWLSYMYFGQKKISDTQDQRVDRQDAIDENIRFLTETVAELRKFQENHSMHEIPNIVKTLEKMDSKLDKMQETQISQGLDIATLKAKVK